MAESWAADDLRAAPAPRTDHTRYVPVLLTSQAECRALHDVSWRAKRRMTPLLVVTPLAWSYDADGPATSVTDHLAALPDQLAHAWSGGRAFIDTRFIPDDERIDDEPVLSWLVTEADRRDLTLVPVVGLHGQGETDEMQEIHEIVAGIAQRDHRGLCLRLQPEEWPTRAGPIRFRRMLGRLRTDPAHTDLVLDLGDVSGADEEVLFSSVVYELDVLPFPDSWRSVTVTASSTPYQPAVGVQRVHRREWSVHRRLVRDRVLPRRPAFGDYGVAHPDPRADIDSVAERRLVALRHTVHDDVLMVRGRLHEPIPGGGADGRSVPAAATWIRNHPDFVANHCAFEEAVQAVAARRQEEAPTMPWRRLATRHHLETVVEQLVELHGDGGLDQVPERRRSGG